MFAVEDYLVLSWNAVMWQWVRVGLDMDCSWLRLDLGIREFDFSPQIAPGITCVRTKLLTEL